MSKKASKRRQEAEPVAEAAPEVEPAELVELEALEDEPEEADFQDAADTLDAQEMLVPAERLAEAESERDEYKDQVLRARAEFDNFRKRTMREAELLRKTAAQGLVRDLLPVLDNLHRAFDHIEDRSHPLAQGMEMVTKQFEDVLAAHGVAPIAALGQPFDPNLHEALTHQPSAEIAADHVATEYQRGYTMAGQVLRPAKVVVSSGLAADGMPDTEQEETAS